MENTIIVNNYLEYSQTEEFLKKQKEFGLDAYREAYKKFVINPKKDEPVLVGAVEESTYFGFIEGFKYAMRLMKECGIE